MEALQKFNSEDDKKKRVQNILNIIDHSNYVDDFLRTIYHGLIVNVRRTKHKEEKILAMHLLEDILKDSTSKEF